MPKTTKKHIIAKTTLKKAKVRIIKSDTKDSATPAKHSKQGILLSVLKREKGATMEDMINATGWQPHSVRGTLSGVIKKRLGFTIVSSIEDHGRIYRITGERR